MWCSFRGNSVEAERFWAQRGNKESQEVVSLVSEDSPPTISLVDSDDDEETPPAMPIHPVLLKKRRASPLEPEFPLRKTTKWVHDPSVHRHRTLPTKEIELYLSERAIPIPEHYVDPISCSLMTKPHVTPSGHRVDHSTRTYNARSTFRHCTHKRSQW